MIEEWIDEVKKPTPILVVDDNETDRKLFGMLSEPFHRELMEAGTGNQAIELLKSREFKIVILDIRMPDMNGIEVYRWIQGNVKPLPKVVFFTGHAMSAVKEINAIGPAIIVEKPLENQRKFISEMLEQYGVPKKP